MNHISTTRLKWAVALSAALMLGACGDSDDDDATGGGGTTPPPVATGDVPASAQASVSAWTTFVGAQAKTETGKALDLTGVVAPFSDTAPPLPI